MWFLSLLIAVLVSYAAFGFSWTPIITKYSSDSCIPARYESIDIKVPLAAFLQGDVNPSPITSYAIPLQDGILGGWAAWPLTNPSVSFSIRHPGFVYLMQSDCTDVYASDVLYANTRTWTDGLRVIGNDLRGVITVYTPPNSIIQDYQQLQSTTGYKQDCTIIAKFFDGIVENGFASDEWQMVAFKKVLPDRYYHDSLMSQGVLGALAATAHMLLMQYNASGIDVCDYYALNGSGYLSASESILLTIQVLVVILGVTMLMHAWWIYLMYGLDSSLNYAYRSISNRFRFAHDSSKSEELFEENYIKRYDYMTTDDEVLLRLRQRVARFGVDRSSLENEDGPNIIIGTKKNVVSFNKLGV
ncbi:hypothetical protein HDV01_003213 [Terramyces sp. JEL0728]|nr:hypothetical protein HDV01_003213 [Terramyces sp. JEL0728]